MPTNGLSIKPLKFKLLAGGAESNQVKVWDVFALPGTLSATSALQRRSRPRTLSEDGRGGRRLSGGRWAGLRIWVRRLREPPFLVGCKGKSKRKATCFVLLFVFVFWGGGSLKKITHFRLCFGGRASAP